MARYIEVEMNGETLKLEYNRDAIVKMEEMGFNIQEVASKVYTSYETMVIGALVKNHSDKKMREAVNIAESLAEEYGLNEVMEKLTELYQDALHIKGKSKKKLAIKGTKLQA